MPYGFSTLKQSRLLKVNADWYMPQLYEVGLIIQNKTAYTHLHQVSHEWH